MLNANEVQKNCQTLLYGIENRNPNKENPLFPSKSRSMKLLNTVLSVQCYEEVTRTISIKETKQSIDRRREIERLCSRLIENHGRVRIARDNGFSLFWVLSLNSRFSI